VSELSKRAGAKPCPRCKASMEEVLRIAPAQADPGLIAYECPSCGSVTSDLTPRNPEPPGKQRNRD
jgi:transposase-like protein